LPHGQHFSWPKAQAALFTKDTELGKTDYQADTHPDTQAWLMDEIQKQQ
jgi:hypothetical protein